MVEQYCYTMVQQNQREGEPENDNPKIISADTRPIRDLGGSYGISFDKDALEELGVIDENGEPNGSARELVWDNGRAEIEIEPDD